MEGKARVRRYLPASTNLLSNPKVKKGLHTAVSACHAVKDIAAKGAKLVVPVKRGVICASNAAQAIVFNKDVITGIMYFLLFSALYGLGYGHDVGNRRGYRDPIPPSPANGSSSFHRKF